MSASEQVAISGLGASVLGRLLCRSNGYTPYAIAQTLQLPLKAKGSHIEPSRLIENELIGFQQAGLVKRVRKASYQLTRDGERVIRAILCLPQHHKSKAENWRDIKKNLTARRLDEDVSAAASSREIVIEIPPADAARIAALLVGAFHLDLGTTPALARVLGAVAWSAIGVTTAEPFTLEAVMRVLLGRLADAPAQATLRQVIDLLVRKASTLATSARGLLAPQTAALPADEPTFAARVIEAARASKSGRFGDNKVFISHVLRRLVEEGVAIDDAEAFKARLVSAHRSGLLALNRADLVEAMEPADVDASETRYLSTTFHFVRI
ncbi:uncharacterized protein SOCEGT47_029480 [Sorangium cellulosum]|uniref:Uncharacterized protein n=1 Tax=Sorangium cellulosum TaxID=56 RepID=A0A4P2PZV4_SORCE|nr:hypothetical protein [Sorangium cellulosum]AUX22445.1 uncharacterized protein SOCEGT47_029480 [Sorangium cellulosum]